MNGVDRHNQLRLKYPLERDSKKAGKYIYFFLVNCAIANAFCSPQPLNVKIPKKDLSIWTLG